MLDEYPPPKDFDAFVYLSQVQQAEGIKIGAEALRRRRPRTMGSLYWQLNDCWPVASWSSLDYFGRWKALHHYARRFYAPLLVSLTAEDADVSVWVVSDSTAPAPATLLARLLDVSGKVLWEKREELVVTPLSSTRVWSVPRTELLGGRDPATVFLWAELRIAGEVASANRRFFVPAKAAALPRPNVEVEVAASAQGLRIRLKSDVLARSVRLSYEPDDGSFSDNYFDLLPGAPVEVLYRPEGDVTVEALRQGLSVTTLVDAFASTAGGGVSLQGENQ
jgi:beta-mannosidase